MPLRKKSHNMVRKVRIIKHCTCHRHRLFIDAQHQNSFSQCTSAEFTDNMEEFFNEESEKEKQNERGGKKDRQKGDRHVNNSLAGYKIVSET